jgi:hypothetical protein
VFETSGLLRSTNKKFLLTDTSEWTLRIFKDEVNHGNKVRLQKLTTGVDSYQGAHVALPRHALPCPTKPDANCEGISLF